MQTIKEYEYKMSGLIQAMVNALENPKLKIANYYEPNNQPYDWHGFYGYRDYDGEEKLKYDASISALVAIEVIPELYPKMSNINKSVFNGTLTPTMKKYHMHTSFDDNMKLYGLSFEECKKFENAIKELCAGSIKALLHLYGHEYPFKPLLGYDTSWKFTYQDYLTDLPKLKEFVQFLREKGF